MREAGDDMAIENFLETNLIEEELDNPPYELNHPINVSVLSSSNVMPDLSQAIYLQVNDVDLCGLASNFHLMSGLRCSSIHSI